MKPNRTFCKLCTAVNNLLKEYFAPYIVIDCYGTDVLCWSMKEAQAWIPYCSKSAYIMETYDYAVLVSRLQGA